MRAIDDAKRAADLIRGEAVNVEREAAIALERLRDAAEAARTAAIGARTRSRTTTPRRATRARSRARCDARGAAGRAGLRPLVARRAGSAR